jgi:hypothetical protein
MLKGGTKCKCAPRVVLCGGTSASCRLRYLMLNVCTMFIYLKSKRWAEDKERSLCQNYRSLSIVSRSSINMELTWF